MKLLAFLNEIWRPFLDAETKSAIINVSTQLERLNINIKNLTDTIVIVTNIKNDIEVEISKKNEDSTKAVNKSLGAIDKYLKKWTQSN